jgi:hypothetical protein
MPLRIVVMVPAGGDGSLLLSRKSFFAFWVFLGQSLSKLNAGRGVPRRASSEPQTNLAAIEYTRNH